MADGKTRVLLVEDNESDVRYIRMLLGEVGRDIFHLDQVACLQDALDFLAQSAIDVVILDLTLPDSHGFATFAKIHQRSPQLPIVVVSGLDEESLAVDAVKQGAQDYLVKNHLSAHLLARALRYAIERKNLQREAIEMVTQQQQRISQDLHDGVGQELTGLSYMAKSLAKKLDSQALPEAKLANEIVTAAQHALTEVGHAVRGLAPVEVDSQGLMVALQGLANTTQSRFDIPCRFTYDQPVPVTDAHTATHLFRIAQEAVNNAVKHARASHITVVLIKESDDIVLRVADDGIGIQSEMADSGLGLRSMHLRAGAIGANLQVSSNDGQGTTISCLLKQG